MPTLIDLTTPLENQALSEPTFARSVPLRPGCLRFPGLPARASRPLGFVRPSSTRASRRTRPLLRTRFEASPETAAEIRPCALRGNSIAQTSPHVSAGCPLPVLRSFRVACDRTSLRPRQRAVCVRSDPMAAWRPGRATGMPAANARYFVQCPRNLALFTYFELCTLNFLLSPEVRNE